MAASTSRPCQVSTWITRSGHRPTDARLGAKRSRAERHHRTGPSSRARMAARKSVAAAMSPAPPAKVAPAEVTPACLPASPSWKSPAGPPQISCSAPSRSPPSGKCLSIAAASKGSVFLAPGVVPSSAPISWRRRESTPARQPLSALGMCSAMGSCSLFVLIDSQGREKSQAGEDGGRQASHPCQNRLPVSWRLSSSVMPISARRCGERSFSARRVRARRIQRPRTGHRQEPRGEVVMRKASMAPFCLSGLTKVSARTEPMCCFCP